METGGRLRAASVAQFLRAAISTTSGRQVGKATRTESAAPEEQQDALAAAVGSSSPPPGGDDASPETLLAERSRDLQLLLLESEDDPLGSPSRLEGLDARCDPISPDTQDSSDEDRAIESEESASSCCKYTVAYESYEEAEQPDDSPRAGTNSSSSERASLFEGDGAKQLQFVDVLLQADEHGLGLNLRVARGNEQSASLLPPAASPSTRTLVVASFRRLHPYDVGPAEATRQIRKGDILHSIDGEEVRDWEHLLDLVSRSSSQRTDLSQMDARDPSSEPFLLLRFLRRRVDALLESPVSTVSLSTDEDAFSREAERGVDGVECSQARSDDPSLPPARAALNTVTQGDRQVALLIRELATKNQTLQDELVASQLKQEEQRIHLEQLYALYAKTQLDSSPVFALPKPSILPFTRRGAGTAASPASDKLGFVSARLASAAGVGAKADPTLKLHAEIELAVLAEQEKLRKQYTLQLAIETREAAAKHQRELQQLRARMEKKVEMLDAGLQQALLRAQQAETGSRRERESTRDRTTTTGSIETCSCGTWMRLQQELYIHQSLDHDDGGASGAECLVCNLLTDARRTSSAASTASPETEEEEEKNSEAQEERRSPDVSRIQRVLELLREYEAIKAVRAQRFEAFDTRSTAKQTECELRHQQP